MAYCVIGDVEALTQPTGAAYGASSQPTATQVGSLIDLINSEINTTVMSAGYELPITGTDALNFLKLTNAYGAASLSKQAQVQSGVPEVTEQIADLWAKYQKNLDTIRTVKGALGDQVKTSGIPRSLWTSHSADGSDDAISDISPYVRRDTKF